LSSYHIPCRLEMPVPAWGAPKPRAGRRHLSWRSSDEIPTEHGGSDHFPCKTIKKLTLERKLSDFEMASSDFHDTLLIDWVT
jgi:hypothetical protein